MADFLKPTQLPDFCCYSTDISAIIIFIIICIVDEGIDFWTRSDQDLKIGRGIQMALKKFTQDSF